ncbi:juvenile hormone epoxide hydrolase protein 4 [Danaus plexippus plexippus]|uniref:microsomal epoxide hydrolase n=1 Tax=Danaus plexippus plexippus TaxID=278856 RepID=A0A212EXY4_DANPL|nr:juvenile hormone epoxide hydrolase protein 4 [Danaus plexippus plexippus]
MASKKKDKKKDKINDDTETAAKKDKKKGWSLILSSIIAGLLGAFVYRLYVSYVVVPELPKFDLDVWWGSGPRSSQDISIRPYRILLLDSMQENIRRKFEAYRRATKIKSLNESSSYGLNSDNLGQIFAHWQFKYNYRERTRYFNKYDHFKTNIQGLDMHFVHVKPTTPGNVRVLPLLLLHGWPSSVKDFYEMIPLLTTPRTGYDFVFEIIAPSLPGFAHSQGAARPGLTTYEIAIIMRNLMKRIGFNQFYIHGGDIGHAIGSHMATIFPNQILGFHTTTPINYSYLASMGWFIGSICPKCLLDNYVRDKMYPLSDKLSFYLEESGYFHLQSTKPDTIGIALQDSPLGLAAYIIERYLLYTNPNSKFTPEEAFSGYNMTDLLDNVMLYWSTGSITTSLRLFKETVRNYEMEQVLARIPTSVPTWGLRTKNDLFHQNDNIIRWKYPNLRGLTNLEVGGHFPAFEIPSEVASDIFKSVKKFLLTKKV